MKTHLIYASAIVIAAFILGFFYALAHHYQRVPTTEVNGDTGYCTLNTWNGVTERFIRAEK